MNQCVQASWLSVLELCELSQKNTVDADGNPVKVMDSATLSEHIRLDSVDIAKFTKMILIGEILSLEAKVIYSDPKSGRVYVQIEVQTFDPIKS